MKKVRYYLVVVEGSSLYVKLECDYGFSVEEGETMIKEDYPKYKRITHIVKSKAQLFLGLK